MNAVADAQSKKLAGSRIAVAVLLLLAVGVTCSALQAFERGPIFCNNGCGIESPAIDERTKAFLESHRAPVDYVPLWMFATGTTYLVCNQTHCASYRQTIEGNYITDQRVERQPSGGGEGSPWAGGGGGGGYGGGGGGGGSSGGSGTVTVGAPGPVKPPEIPTNDF